MFTLLWNQLISHNSHHSSWFPVISTQEENWTGESVTGLQLTKCKSQRASQHRARFLYPPPLPFQFTWSVSYGRTMTVLLIWFLPGTTCLLWGFSPSPPTHTHRHFLCWWEISWAGWRKDDSHSCKAKLSGRKSKFSAHEKYFVS